MGDDCVVDSSPTAQNDVLEIKTRLMSLIRRCFPTTCTKEVHEEKNNK